jgi:predicted nucleic acid-binding protein
VLLLDAGVWVAAVDPEDRYHSSARPLTLAATVPAATLDLTLYEVANVIGTRKRQRDLAGRVCRAILERCGEHVVRIDAELAEVTVAVAAEHGLTAYDAAYVAAARRHGWTLVSTDLKDLVAHGLALTPDDQAIDQTPLESKHR